MAAPSQLEKHHRLDWRHQTNALQSRHGLCTGAAGAKAQVNVQIVAYPGESDKGPFPVPDNIPLEGWPVNYLRNPKLQNVTLDDVQRDKLKEGGDRHALVVDPVNRMLYEFYQTAETEAGWQASQHLFSV